MDVWDEAGVGFWSINGPWARRMVAVCVLLGGIVALCGALLGHATGRFETRDVEVLVGGVALGVFLALLIVTGSWHQHLQERRSFRALSLGDPEQYDDLQFGLTNLGDRAQVVEQRVVGVFKGCYFQVWSFSGRLHVEFASTDSVERRPGQRSLRTASGMVVHRTAPGRFVAHLPKKPRRGSQVLLLPTFLDELSGIAGRWETTAQQ
jgi:hypothetical protein